MGPGTHGSTFGGNPLACSAALATLNILEAENLPQKAAETGERLKTGLEKMIGKYNIVKDVRGLGLLLGMELSESPAPFVQALMERGFLVTGVANNTLRFTPPLNVTEVEVDGVLTALDEIFTESEG